jgi:hypothetical protein
MLASLARLDSLAYRRYASKPRFDSLAAFVSHELLQIVPDLYARKYPALDATRHIPTKPGINPGAMAWAFTSYDQRGMADFVGPNSKDIPRVDVAKDFDTFPIRTIATSYGWNLEEMEAARFANAPLDSAKPEAARRAMAEKENETLLLGNDARGIPGFLTHGTIPIMTVAVGDWLNAARTGAEIVSDLNSMVDHVTIITRRAHQVNTILLPELHYRKAQTAMFGTNDKTALGFFREANPGVNVEPLTELATAGPSGGPRAIAYEKDPANLGGVLPLPFDQLDPQVSGFETLIIARERIGGAVWLREMSAVYVDGI